MASGRIPSGPIIKALNQYVIDVSPVMEHGKRDLAHLQFAAQRYKLKYETLVSWLQRPERASAGMPFVVADRILCATDQSEMWQGALSEYYEAVDMNWQQCQHRSCRQYFRLGETPVYFCSEMCEKMEQEMKDNPLVVLESCRKGHPRTEENTRVRGNGKRECAVCHRERTRIGAYKSKERKQMAVAA